MNKTGYQALQGDIAIFHRRSSWLREPTVFRKIAGNTVLHYKVYRIITNKETNQEIKKELILNNHSKVMYDYNLIPKEEIKE